MFTDSDVGALRASTELLEHGIIDETVQLAMARTLGQTMSRLAEWQVEVVSRRILDNLAEAGAVPSADEIRRVASDVTSETVPALEALLLHAWRRHLAAAAERTFAGAGPNSTRKELVVGFADMVGYTRLTRHIDEHQLNDLLEAFESNATAVIAKGNGWIVKNVGDEVMFATESPDDAAKIALELQESTAESGQTPQLRVGLAAGPVLQRFGDLFGSVVNLASRLTGVAHPGTVLIDDNLYQALRDDPAYNLKHLKGFVFVDSTGCAPTPCVAANRWTELGRSSEKTGIRKPTREHKI